MSTTRTDYETVIGLEVHCELLTATKLFCGCLNGFGAEPNTHVCPVCLGLPGSLPVLNEQAVELAMRIGTALHCDVRPSAFHRKNYFYPDMPKDYQISQYDAPINVGGWLDLPDGSRVGIVRAHLEEDTGKTTHVGSGGRIHAAEHSLVDYNRAGVPLVETVSAPDLRSATQARTYVQELRALLVALGVSDGRMEEGSLRVDANVSVRPRTDGAPDGTRCEIKNLNSLRSLARAIEFESARQIALLESGAPVTQETRHWDEEAGQTSTLRSKEEAFDYRYFPEPDLVPLAPEDEWRVRVERSMPTLPSERRAALEQLLGGEPTRAQHDQVMTVVDQGLDTFVLSAADSGLPPDLALARAANELAAEATARTLPPESFVGLLRLESSGTLSATQAKEVLAELVANGGGDPSAIAKSKGFEAMAEDSLVAVVGEVVEANPAEWQRYLEGEEKLAGFFTGQVMKATRGQANGKAVAAELRRRKAEQPR